MFPKATSRPGLECYSMSRNWFGLLKRSRQMPVWYASEMFCYIKKPFTTVNLCIILTHFIYFGPTLSISHKLNSVWYFHELCYAFVKGVMIISTNTINYNLILHFYELSIDRTFNVVNFKLTNWREIMLNFHYSFGSITFLCSNNGICNFYLNRSNDKTFSVKYCNVENISIMHHEMYKFLNISTLIIFLAVFFRENFSN